MAARRIIFVADIPPGESGSLGSLMGALAEAGAMAEFLTEGLASLAQAAGERADLVVVDLDAPDLGGIDALVTIRRVASRVPVLVLTGEDTKARRMWAVETGAAGYATKPVDGALLARWIAKVLRLRAPHIN